MGQRVLDQVQHLPVELGLGALHLELDRLAELRRQIAHDPRQLLPGISDRLHARLHDAFLQLGGNVRQPLQWRLELGILVAPANVEELIAREHELRDHGHQVLERIDMHADRLVGDLAVGALVVAPRRLFRLDLLGARRRRRLCWRSGWRIGRSRLIARSRRIAECAFKLIDCGLVRRRLWSDQLGHWRIGDLRCHPIKLGDQVTVVACRFSFIALKLIEQHLDAVDGREDERHGFAGDAGAVAELAHQRFGSVRQRLQPRQIEEAARPLDGVDETKDLVENLGVVGVLLKAHQFDVNHIDAFVRFGQEVTQQLVHGGRNSRGNAKPPQHGLLGDASVCW